MLKKKKKIDDKNVDQDGHVLFLQLGSLYSLTLPVWTLKDICVYNAQTDYNTPTWLQYVLKI